MRSFFDLVTSKNELYVPSFAATDQGGNATGSSTTANGRLRIRQTYGSGSYHSSTLTLRSYYDAFTGINISTS